MKRNKLISSILAGLLLLVMIVGCSKDTGKTSEEISASAHSSSSKPLTIAVIVKDISDPWFIRMQEGVETYAKETGSQCYIKGPSKTDSAEQIQVIEQQIEAKPDAICVVPVDSAACEPVLKKARDQGIVVITHEAPGFENCDFDIEAFDNDEYGRVMMDKLAEATGETGKYVTMVAFLSTVTHNREMDAAVEQQKEKYPNMELIPEKRIECEDNMDIAYNKAKEIIKKYPDIKGFIGASSYDPPGVAKAIEEMGKTGQIFAVGTGVPSISSQYLTSGSNPTVLSWDPAKAGQAMCQISTMLLNGEREKIKSGLNLKIEGYENLNVDKNSICGNAILIIDKNNMNEYPF